MARKEKVLVEIDQPFVVFLNKAGREVCNNYGQCTIRTVNHYKVLMLEPSSPAKSEDVLKDILGADDMDYITIIKPKTCRKYIELPLNELIELYRTVENIRRAGAGAIFENTANNIMIDKITEWIEKYGTNVPKEKYLAKITIQDVIDRNVVDILDALIDKLAEILKKKIELKENKDLTELLENDEEGKKLLDEIMELAAGMDLYLDDELKERGIKIIFDQEE